MDSLLMSETIPDYMAEASIRSLKSTNQFQTPQKLKRLSNTPGPSEPQ